MKEVEEAGEGQRDWISKGKQTLKSLEYRRMCKERDGK